MTAPHNARTQTQPARVLVSAATMHGSTAEIAGTIGEALADEGLDVTVLPPEQVETVEEYDAVVLGSAVYAGHWLDPAQHLARRCRSARGPRDVWLFSSGPVGEPGSTLTAAMDRDPVELSEVQAATHAHEHRMFPGRLDPRSLNLLQRAAMRFFPRMAGDFRDWSEISAWARGIARQLNQTR